MVVEIDTELGGYEHIACVSTAALHELCRSLIASDDEISGGGHGPINGSKQDPLPSGALDVFPGELTEQSMSLEKSFQNPRLPADARPRFIFDEHYIKAARPHDSGEADVVKGGASVTRARQADELIAACGGVRVVVELGRGAAKDQVLLGGGGDADELEMCRECLELLAIFERGIGVANKQQAGSHAGDEAAPKVASQTTESAAHASAKICTQSSPAGRML